MNHVKFPGCIHPLSVDFGVLQGFDVGGAVWLDDEAGDGWDLSQGALGNLDFTENLWRIKKICINCYYFQLAGFWCISFGSFVCFIGQKSSNYPHWRDQTMQFCMVGHFQKKKVALQNRMAWVGWFPWSSVGFPVFFWSIHPFGLLAEGTIDTTGFAASLGPQGGSAMNYCWWKKSI